MADRHQLGHARRVLLLQDPDRVLAPVGAAHSACASSGTDSRSARPSAIRVSTAFGRSSTPRWCFLPLAGFARFFDLTAAFAIAVRLSRAERIPTSFDLGEVRLGRPGYGDPAETLIPTWLRRYDRRWMPTDAMAGLTIWALIVPQAMAYAAIASVHDTLDALGIR